MGFYYQRDETIYTDNIGTYDIWYETDGLPGRGHETPAKNYLTTFPVITFKHKVFNWCKEVFKKKPIVSRDYQ